MVMSRGWTPTKKERKQPPSSEFERQQQRKRLEATLTWLKTPPTTKVMPTTRGKAGKEIVSPGMRDWVSANTALGAVTTPTTTPDGGGIIQPPQYGEATYTDASGRIMVSDGLGGFVQTGFDPTNIYQQQPTGYPTPTGNVPQDSYGRTATWDTDNAEWRYPPDWNVDPQTQQAGYITPQQQWERDEAGRRAEADRQSQQQMMDWYREEAQMRQQEQERQYRSQLAANPMSWLQYASYTGEQPVVQPWMLPLMSQQYQGGAGTPIPGWQGGGQGQQGGGTGMSQLAPLFNPSAQYWARMGPTGQQQYMGYQQARGGATPEETMFRQRSQAPPGGRYGGLSWMR